MEKMIYHNSKPQELNVNINNSNINSTILNKKNVDINKILNRIRTNKKKNRIKFLILSIILVAAVFTISFISK